MKLEIRKNPPQEVQQYQQYFAPQGIHIGFSLKLEIRKNPPQEVQQYQQYFAPQGIHIKLPEEFPAGMAILAGSAGLADPARLLSNMLYILRKTLDFYCLSC